MAVFKAFEKFSDGDDNGIIVISFLYENMAIIKLLNIKEIKIFIDKVVEFKSIFIEPNINKGFGK